MWTGRRDVSLLPSHLTPHQCSHTSYKPVLKTRIQHAALHPVHIHLGHAKNNTYPSPCTASPVVLSLSHTAIVTVLAFPKLSCFSQSLCRYHYITAVALEQPFLPSHPAPGSSPPAADIAHMTHDHKPCISYVVLVWLGRSFAWNQTSEETKMDGFISWICLEVHVAATDLQVNQLLFFSVYKVIFGQECCSLSVWAPLEASSSCEPWAGSLSSLQVLCGKLSVPRRMSQVFAHMKFIPCYFRKRQRGS